MRSSQRPQLRHSQAIIRRLLLPFAATLRVVFASRTSAGHLSGHCRRPPGDGDIPT